MNLTEDQTTELTRLAALLMSPREIAILLSLPIQEFLMEIKNPHSHIYKIYQKEVLNRKANIKEKVLKLAEMGSPQAQVMANEYITDQEVNYDTEQDY